MKAGTGNILKTDKGAMLTLALITLVIMFFLSYDSYLYFSFGRCDSANFLTAGRAWANGMMPYVDFSDSKGPLIWLIYAIGYMLSPTSFHGVFWLSIIAVVLTVAYIYRTARLYSTQGKAFYATLLTLMAMFCPLWHDETRVETFCWPFIAASIYETLWAVRLEDKEALGKQIIAKALILGISFGATLLMKFTIPAMLLLCPILFAFALKDKARIWQTVLGFSVGVAVIILPFVLYFLVNGALDDALREYFAATASTDTNLTEGSVLGFIGKYLHYIVNGLINYDAPFSCIVFLMPIATYYFCKKDVLPSNKRLATWKRYTPFFIHIWILAICTYRSDISMYYFEPCSVIYVFDFLLLTDKGDTEPRLVKTAFITIAGILLFFPQNSAFKAYSLPVFTKNNSRNLANAYEHLESIFKQVERPKIMSLEFGMKQECIGIEANTLPATKYWFMQVGATENMKDNQKEAIINRLPDFILTNGSNPLCAILGENGYTPCKTDRSLPFSVYGKCTKQGKNETFGIDN